MSDGDAARVAIVVPIGREEARAGAAFADLRARPPRWRLFVVGGERFGGEIEDGNIEFLAAAEGRAQSMNLGARAATRWGADFFWFVHCDSQLSPRCFAALVESIARRPHATHYFDLRFFDGGKRMRVNEFGARLRCALFGNPFGDQALCVSRRLFETVGGFDESAPFGEDHLLVLRARKAGFPPRRVRAAVRTSARRYRAEGWLRLMWRYQRAWPRQYWRERCERCKH